ncbi:hypothetical protein DFJ58DRAFT_735278 [Suillus subalutaceus]|uniref:uncharacterized protein n=1 Tax=Suillus subalutaceus TaxID=48586 RepID=UPI001B871DAE|nr:uncharacterized protein DFJ58DRAFT_735278 [Suillus subalutaceus]KAG1835998.1 hypothetical protein DFJ58DRAFT_735278 [Suillus subalutaceus]
MTPVWSKICPDDPWSQRSPLYPLSIGYEQLLPPPSPPVAGPSQLNGTLPQAPAVVVRKGKGKEKAPPEAMSVSTAPKSKQQHASSKAMVTSKDERELDNESILAQTLATKKKLSLPTRLPTALKGLCPCRKSLARLVITSDDEREGATPNPVLKTVVSSSYVEIDNMDETPITVGPAPKMGTPCGYPGMWLPLYIAISNVLQPAPKPSKAVPEMSSTIASVLTEDDHADTTLLVWLPGCRSCMQRQLVCHQAYNTAGVELAVCARFHWSKHKCGGKGSAPPNRGKKSTAAVTHHTHSRSCCQSPVYVTETAVASTSGAPAGGVAKMSNTSITATPTAAITSAPTASAPATPVVPTAATTTTTTTTAAANVATPATATTPSSPTSHTDKASVLALREDITLLQATVTSLEEKVSAGEQLLPEANRRMAKQEASFTLLAEQLAAPRQELCSPKLTSPVSLCLPVMMNPVLADLSSCNSMIIAETEVPARSVSCNGGIVVETEDHVALVAEEVYPDMSISEDECLLHRHLMKNALLCECPAVSASCNTRIVADEDAEVESVSVGSATKE